MNARVRIAEASEALSVRWQGNAIAALLLRRWLGLAVALTVALAAAFACGSQSEVPADSVPADSDAPTSEPKTLTVYSGRSSSLVEPILKEFSVITGVPIEVRYGSTGEMAATLLEEGVHSPADVFFAQEPGGLGVVEPLLERLPAEIYDAAPEWARDPDGKWVGITGRARVIVYNTDELSPSELPESIAGFTDPKWRGKLGFPPTNASFQLMVTAMRADWGESRTRRWLEGIMANAPQLYAKNTPTVAAVESGEVLVGFVNHYYLHRFLAEAGDGFAARNYYTPASDAGSLVMAAGAGILATADAVDEAARLLAFLQGLTAQQYFADKTHEYPFNPSVRANPKLPELGAISDRFGINLGTLSDLEGTQDLLREVGALP